MAIIVYTVYIIVMTIIILIIYLTFGEKERQRKKKNTRFFVKNSRRMQANTHTQHTHPHAHLQQARHRVFPHSLHRHVQGLGHLAQPHIPLCVCVFVVCVWLCVFGCVCESCARAFVCVFTFSSPLSGQVATTCLE